MKVFSSGNLKTRYEQTTQELPLGALTHETNASTGEKIPNTVNPDLPELLAAFAYYLHKKADGELYKAILGKWLLPYLKKAPSGSPEEEDETFQLLPELQDPTSLFTRIRQSVTELGAEEHLVYVGLYLFAAWFFLVQSVDRESFTNETDYVLSDRVKSYVATKSLVEWVLMQGDVKAAKINPSWLHRSGKYTEEFARQFRVQNFTLGMMRNSILGNVNAMFEDPASTGAALTESVKNEAGVEFLKFFRGKLQDVLKQEFLSLLKISGLETSGKIEDLGLYAVGDGGGSMGFFGIEGFGLSFFDYELVKIEESPYVEPKLERTVSIGSGGLQTLPSVFLAQWGADWENSKVIVKVDAIAASEIKVQETGQAYLRTTDNPAFKYDHSTGLLTFKRRLRWVQLTYDTTVPISIRPADWDDIAFLTLRFVPSTPPPAPIADPRLRADYLFADNEFVVPQSAPLWSSAAEQAALKAIVLKMRDDPEFTIVSTVWGGGVGRRIDLKGPDELGSDLTSAEDQSDNQTAAAPNQGLRYAYGEAIWTTGTGVKPDQLNLCTEGYASPLRCTWSSWAAFLANVVGGGPKADEVFAEIGQRLRTSLGRGPSYNTALSAFRAFGMLEAMVRRLQLCAFDLTGTELNNDQRIAIHGKLEQFLKEQASCALPQVGLDREAGVKVDYKMFHKYAD